MQGQVAGVVLSWKVDAVEGHRSERMADVVLQMKDPARCKQPSQVDKLIVCISPPKSYSHGPWSALSFKNLPEREEPHVCACVSNDLVPIEQMQLFSSAYLA